MSHHLNTGLSPQLICQTSVLSLYKGATLVIYELQTLYLSGLPSLETGTLPPSCIYLDKCLYILTVFLRNLKSLEFAPVKKIVK